MSARIVIAGTGSGAGKTSVACGLMGALRRRGLIVQGHKVGPDYIDPSYHALASGRPGRNLDAFLSGPELIAPLQRHGAQGAEIAVIEGVMGLFDGASGSGELASTAHIAKLLRAPVVLVVDAGAMARSAAAVVHGFATFDPEVRLAGVIFNRVGSTGHEQLLREAMAGSAVPVLGALRADDRVSAPERHLGLVPAAERESRAVAALASLAAAVQRDCDLDAIVRVAGTAPGLTAPPWSPEPEPGAGPLPCHVRIAIARGPAFSFHYQENLELLTAAGAELTPVDPTVDESLPVGSDALILAGGFPEVFGAELTANQALRVEVAAFARSGRPVLAECGGLLYLCERLGDQAMCGVLPAYGEMADRLTIGYREAVAATATPWLPAGTQMRGHEFHRSHVVGDAVAPAWRLTAGDRAGSDGFVVGGIQASYLHTHWAAWPAVAGRFAAAAGARRTSV